MNVWKYISIILCTLVIASCGSKKTTATISDTAETAIASGSKTSLNKVVETINANRQTAQFATSKINLSLKAGSKDVSVGGTLKMKKNDVIQLSLVVLGMIEAGRMEFTKDYFMIVDRMGHQYVKAGYNEIDFLNKNNIDFYTFQSLFWDELFVLGDQGVAPTASKFTTTSEAGNVKLSNADSRQVTLNFLANAASGLIQQTTFANKTTNAGVLDWQYQEFSKFGKSQFPSKMQVSFKIGSTPVSATISMGNINSDSDWETRTELSKKYEKVAVETVLRRLMSMTL